MRNISTLFKRTLKSVLPAILALTFVVPALAQVPSFAPPVLQRSTYAATIAALAVPATGAGDAACLVGSATRTIRVTKITFSGSDTTAQSAVTNIVKRTAASTGGTSTSPTVALYDSSNAAATAVMNAYTVVPTPGAGLNIYSGQFYFNTAALGGLAPVTLDYVPQEKLNQQLTLRGVAQQLCVNFPNAFTTAGPALNVQFEWTEQ